MALYSEKVMDHFRNPRNVGVIENADGVGEVGNAKCGDIMKIYLKIENDIIVDVKFETFGCGSAIASSSVATEMIKGKTLEEALAYTNQNLVDERGGLPAHGNTPRLAQTPREQPRATRSSRFRGMRCRPRSCDAQS